MAVHSPRASRSFTKPRPQTAISATLPSPIKGMDGRTPISNQGPENCLYAYNIVPSEYGIRTRRGYREIAINVPQTAGIQTLIPFDGQNPAGTGDKLFVATSSGIYDVTTPVDAPTPVFTWPLPVNDAAGYGQFTNFTNDNGDHVLLYADSIHGLHIYTETTGLWTLATGITNATIADIRFVMIHNQRVWIIEEGAANAKYLPVGAFAGAATNFNFGALFAVGGDLVGLWNWTLDGGNGADDYLVAISRGGDVVVFRGEDPSSAVTWTNTGVFRIGKVPAGHRIAVEFGGDLHVLSSFGITAMSDLLRGVFDPGDRGSIAFPIARLLRAEMEDTITQIGWEIYTYETEGQLVVNYPQTSGNPNLQFVYNITTGGWGYWRDLPMYTGNTWLQNLYFGGTDGTVYAYNGTTDNVKYDGTAGSPIQWSMLPNYNDYNSPGSFKLAQFVRPYFLAQQQPDVEAVAYFDYDLSQLGNPSGVLTPQGDVWDTGLWNDAKWSSGEVLPFNGVIGLSGTGTVVAIGFRGQSLERTTLTGWDFVWSVGGVL